MGTCYSCQARIGKPTYPSDMSLNSNSSSKKGSQRLTSNAFTEKTSSRLHRPSSISLASSQSGSHSSAEKLNTSGESGIVLTVENTQNKYKKLQNANQFKTASTSSGPRRSKFGFQQKPKATTNGTSRQSDANRNLMDVSSDSLDSIDSKRSSTYSAKGSLKRNKNLKSDVRAYSPKEGVRWKMIDDSESTTTDSKSVSTHGRSEPEQDRNGNALPSQTSLRTPKKLQGISNVGSGSRIANPGGVSRLPSRLRPPQGKQAERQWVKAGPVEANEHKAANVDRQKYSQSQQDQKITMENTSTTALGAGSKKRRGFFSRDRGKLQFAGSEPRANEENNKQKKHITPDSGIGDSLVEEEISKTVESMLQAGDRKDVKDTINVLSKDIASVTVCDSSDLMTDGCDDSNDNETDDAKNCDTDLDLKLSGSSTELLDREDMEAYLDAIPRPRLDSLGSCSLDSINSDDLMLETDLMDDMCNQSVCSLNKTATLVAGTTTTKTRIQPRANIDQLSQSQPTSGMSKLEKRQFLRRGESSGYWRQDSLKSISGSESGPRGHHLRSQSSTSEAVNELSYMIGGGIHGSSGQPPAVQRRPPKFSRERPASFPGPLTGDSGAPGGRPVQFRQRGKAPSMSDEEQVMVDATTYRAIMQELTDCKTMVFKLKRVIQQEEIGSPFGNHSFAGTLKNGFRLGGSGSMPGSPIVALDASTSNFSFADSPEAEVMQENAELRQQLQSMQKQLDDQDRTIKLLQQQMTKYECGHYGSNGKVLINSTTQTDKPRLAIPKNILRPSSGGVHGGAGGEPVISSRRFQNLKEDREIGGNGDKETKPKSQLPVGRVATRPALRGAGSRLPSMRIQRYNKGQQLQSFSKIAQAQPAN